MVGCAYGRDPIGGDHMPCGQWIPRPAFPHVGAASLRERDMLAVRQEDPTKPYTSYNVKTTKALRERLPESQALRVFWD